MTRNAAIRLAESWTAAGWAVLFYPSGLSSRSRQYVPPILVATRDGWNRRVYRTGPMIETDPDGNTSPVELARGITT